MAKNWAYLLIVLGLLSGCRGSVSYDTLSTRVPTAIENSESTSGSTGNKVEVSPNANIPVSIHGGTLQDVFMSQLYVREATGNNDGKDVEKYLASTGLPKGNPWCSAFVHWCFEEVKIPNTVTAYSPSAENKNAIIYKLREFKDEPITGDVVTFFYTNLGRIGHTGFYNRRISDVTYESVEGNTNGAGSREGNGVYKKYRSFNSTYSISRWIKH